MHAPKALTDLQWDALLRGIKQDKCIFCVGPEFFSTSNSEGNQSKRLGLYLKRFEEELDIRVRENGWYHLRANGDDGAAYEVVRRFYAAEKNERKEELSILAQIKTHLILSLTPDQHIASTFAAEGFTYRFDAYVRNEPDRNTEVPTKELPLIYNLSGELDQRNSLVLTYDDFFDYIQSTFRGNSMSMLLKDNLLSADYFIFLGMPADDWRMHLFLRILKQHESRKNKYATMPGAGTEEFGSWNEQYGIKLVNTNISGFLQELWKRCQKENLLREKSVHPTSKRNVVDQLRSLVEDNKILQCLEQLLKLLIGSGTAGREVMDNVIKLKARSNILAESISLRIISQNDIDLETNRINHALLNLLNTVEKRAVDLGINL